jgi:thiamine-phosphate pyrophosphorylase
MINFTLYLITDRTQTGNRPLDEVVEAACRAGVRAVQLRERDLEGRELYELGKRIREITRAHDALLFINDRIDIARAIEADGVHLRESSLPIPIARKLLPENALIGASVHSVERAVAAQNQGADFLVYGTIFKTSSKPDLKEPAGVESIISVTRNVSIPVYAVGGIKPHRARMCIEAGAHGVAVVSAIMQSDDIEKTVNQFQEELFIL